MTQPTLFDSYPAREGQAFGAGWIITAPWAHPFWSQYVISLTDLTTPMEIGPPLLYMPGATHEFVLEALDPELPVTEFKIMNQPRLRRLSPPNFAYQFKAASDAAATARIQALVDLIDAGKLSPDTDWRRAWDSQFEDGVSLRKEVIPKELLN